MSECGVCIGGGYDYATTERKNNTMKKLTALLLFAASLHGATVTPTDLTWGAGTYDATYIGKVSAYHNVLSAQTIIDPTPLFLFDSASTVGTVVSFGFASEWIMMFESPEGLFSSVGAFSPDGYPHAVAYLDFVSWEDQAGPGFGDRDWGNYPGGFDLTVGDGADFVLRLERTGDYHVPEPATFALVGLGLLGVAMWRRPETSRRGKGKAI